MVSSLWLGVGGPREESQREGCGQGSHYGLQGKAQTGLRRGSQREALVAEGVRRNESFK